MPSTTKLGLYQPLGTLVATHDATASTTAQFHCTNADASDLNVGMRIRTYNVAAGVYTFLGETFISSITPNTPGAGVTRVVVSPIQTAIPTVGALMFQPEVINPTTAIANQMVILDASMDATLCTPGTRPLVPFLGQITMESAVYKVAPYEIRYWDGASWVLVVGSGGGVAGRLGFAVGTLDGPSIVAGDTSAAYLTLTFGAITGHTYLIDVCACVEGTSFSNWSEALAYVYLKAGATVDTSGSKIAAMGFDTDVDSIATHNSFCVPWTAPSSGTYTIGLFLHNPPGTAQTVGFSAGYNTLSIEDGGIL